jgi:hypothetical protein
MGRISLRAFNLETIDWFFWRERAKASNRFSDWVRDDQNVSLLLE